MEYIVLPSTINFIEREEEMSIVREMSNKKIIMIKRKNYILKIKLYENGKQ